MHRLRRNHSFNDGETRGENLDLQPRRDLFRWNQSPESDRGNQRTDHEMRKMHELRYKNPSMDTESEQTVEQHENDESLKMEEGSVSRIREGKEPRRIEKKDLGGESRRKQSPDGELGKVKDRSRVAHEEIGKKESTKVFGEENLFESSEWQPGQGELCGVIGGD